jgi:hypothetical protein
MIHVRCSATEQVYKRDRHARWQDLETGLCNGSCRPADKWETFLLQCSGISPEGESHTQLGVDHLDDIAFEDSTFDEAQDAKSELFEDIADTLDILGDLREVEIEDALSKSAIFLNNPISDVSEWH